ncbi:MULTISPECIES: AAA family ATPase [Massilia]|jgi:predicted ATP-binding protein involved in virulence|uniref:AAA family ATPase n=1 Tax=Massilia TaxID=149698 RepID=UPI001C62ED51|nr:MULTISPECIES: AAA family ATPase [Massilia]QYG02831.1 AAA family ATPase [Massilia sp. NP310]
MRIEELHLSNIGRFRNLSISLQNTNLENSSVTVFIGTNGGGKTTILRSIATSLSWLTARIRSEQGSGSPIPEDWITNGTNSAAIAVRAKEFGALTWGISKTRAGRKGDHFSHLSELSELAEKHRYHLSSDENTSLPLIAFYPVERSVINVPLKISSKKGYSHLDGYENSLSQGVDFRRFFEWFRGREDMENEIGRPQAVLNMIRQDPDKVAKFINLVEGAESRIDKIEPLDLKSLSTEMKSISYAIKFVEAIERSSKDKQLTAVRQAITNFMPNFSNLRVRRKPKLHMLIDKDNSPLDVSQLSQGEKSLMALVGDIARRLAILNPGSSNPLEGRGIVVIDEVDMHLHPQWARKIVAQLTNTFPNCQFILSTHSPLVISECKDILIYSLEDGQLTEIPSQYGQDANSVLLEVMDTDIRNSDVALALGDLSDHIQDGRFDAAQTLLENLQNDLPDGNIELAKARIMLRKEQLRRAKD